MSLSWVLNYIIFLCCSKEMVMPFWVLKINYFFSTLPVYYIMDDAWAHILTTSRTSSKFAIPCNDINILLLIPELVGLGRYILVLHMNSPTTFLSSLYVWLALSPSLCSWAYLEKRRSWYMILQRVSSCSLNHLTLENPPYHLLPFNLTSGLYLNLLIRWNDS